MDFLSRRIAQFQKVIHLFLRVHHAPVVRIGTIQRAYSARFILIGERERNMAVFNGEEYVSLFHVSNIARPRLSARHFFNYFCEVGTDSRFHATKITPLVFA